MLKKKQLVICNGLHICNTNTNHEKHCPHAVYHEKDEICNLLCSRILPKTECLSDFFIEEDFELEEDMKI